MPTRLDPRYGTQNAAIEVDVGDDPWYPWATNAYNKERPKVTP